MSDQPGGAERARNEIELPCHCERRRECSESSLLTSKRAALKGSALTQSISIGQYDALNGSSGSSTGAKSKRSAFFSFDRKAGFVC